MKIIYLKLAVILILASLFYGCSETTESTNSNKRYIYYAMSESDGASSSEAGLYRYDLSNDGTIKIVNNSVIHVTGVSNDGTIGFEYEGMEQIHWIYNHKFGSVPLSYPVSTDANYVYWIYDVPYLSQSYYGNKFNYFSGYRHFDATDEYKDIPKLVILDYLNSSTKIIEINEICKSLINDTSIEGVQPFNDCILTSNDGNKVWFLINSFDISGHGDVVNIGIGIFYIFEYSEGKVFLKSNTLPNPIICLLGMDYLNEKIFAAKIIKKDTLVFAFDKYNDSIPVNIPFENFSNPEQFAKEKSEMAGWSNDGIAIYDLNTMTVKQNVINWSRIDSLYPGLAHQKNKRLSISPDAEYITFALPLNYSRNDYDLFVIKRDGTEFKRILKGAKVGIPVVSIVIQ